VPADSRRDPALRGSDDGFQRPESSIEGIVDPQRCALERR
jgi:hypothetical protein